MGIFPPAAKSGADQNSMRVEAMPVSSYFSIDYAGARGAVIDAA
jgi:hypothetical protein